MNNILTVAVIGVLAASILLIGASTSVFAQENMTMNTSSSTPVENTYRNIRYRDGNGR